MAQTSVADQQVGAELRGESLPQQGQRALPVPGHVQRACSSCNFGTKKNRHDCGNQKSTLTYTFAAARPSTHLSLLCNTTLSASLVFLPLADGASFFYGMFLSLDLDLYLYRVLYTGCFQVVSVSEY